MRVNSIAELELSGMNSHLYEVSTPIRAVQLRKRSWNQTVAANYASGVLGRLAVPGLSGAHG
jgi:hypothetical protein